MDQAAATYAETPLIVAQAKVKTSSKKSIKKIAKDECAAEALLARPADESDSEAEKPKLGELNEGTEDMPR